MRRLLGSMTGRKALGLVSLAVLGLAAAGAGLAWGAWNHVCDDCPSIAQIYAFEPKEASRVYAADGSLLAEFAVERRTAVPVSALPSYLPQAFVAIEDRRFWRHSGVDYWRTARAGVEYLLYGPGRPGGSTITQQLAGNMFADAVDRREISVQRKLKEMRVALSLEQAYTKREILQAYINQINFGDGRYGVQSASHYYFGKDARDLNLPEAALLAALPRAPQRYSPLHNPERSLQRRNLVLRLMADQGMISRETAERAKAYPLLLRARQQDPGRAPYFVEWVRRLVQERYGDDIYEGGLRIHTTLDPRLQAAADSAVQARLEWVEGQPGFAGTTYSETRSWPEEQLAGRETPYVQGSLVAMDPRTGDVLALVGGRDYRDSEYNRATQARRQPGSVFKPFVFAAALDGGIPASEVIYDTPVEILLPDSTIYSPKNFGDEFRGPVTLREALYRSINVVTVKLGQRVGEETVARYARRLGLETPVPRVPSAAIGSGSLIPLEVTEAYTTFASLGVRTRARPIQRIETADGRVLWESRPDREEVLDEDTSWLMLSILRDVVERGTGAAVRAGGLPLSVPAAGKTGTTNDATDTWFVGFTPDVVATAWIGFDRPARLHQFATGGRNAAPVVTEVLKSFYRNRPAPEDWPRPGELVQEQVDRSSGLLATPWCPTDSVYTEYYLPGTEPQASCDLHGPWQAGGDY